MKNNFTSMTMRNLIVFFCLLFSSVTYAQQGHWFFRFDVGTQATSSSFEGIALSTEFGRMLGGLELSGKMTYYHSKINDSKWRFLQSEETERLSVSSHSFQDKSVQTCFNIRVNAGYDVLHLFNKRLRHHVTPFVGLGYATKTEVRNEEQIGEHRKLVGLNYLPDSGFDVNAGVRYEYSVSDKLRVGLFYDASLVTLEKDLMGITLCKIF